MSELKAEKITYHAGTVTRQERQTLLKQQGATLWFTGLSGSGKSTLAVALEQVLIRHGHAAYTLDGDNVRLGLNAGAKILADTRGYPEAAARRFGLGFSAEDRAENIRRIGEVARLFADAGVIALCSFISPYRKRPRRRTQGPPTARTRAGAIPFVEVFVDTPIATSARQRDPKGLYKQAREAVAAGKGMGFTGVDDPYEAPEKPELTVDASHKSTEENVQVIVDYLRSKGILG